MNVVAMVHRRAEEQADWMAGIWRRSAEGGKLVAVVNADCRRPGWADQVVVWPCDPGHNGLDQCKRHCRCVELAACMEGTTAIVEPDAFCVTALDAPPGILIGSRLWDAKDELEDKRYIARWFLHPPYVAQAETFAAIADVLGWWMANNRIFDDGHNDRVLGLAAQVAGVRMDASGFSRNTIEEWEAGELRRAMEDDGALLIHGVKSRRLIAWWLIAEGFMQGDLWDEMGIEPDRREIPWAMDLRHVSVLRRIVEAVQPPVVMEIGSHRGHSTAGILKGMEKSPETVLHVVEPAPTPELRSLLERTMVRERVTLHQCSSWETGVKADMVFIDGSHEWPALADLAQALANASRLILVHDTRSDEHGIGGCWGARMAADILKRAEGRHWVCDEKRRHGEWTHRGLGASIAGGPADAATAAAVRKIFHAMCP